MAGLKADRGPEEEPFLTPQSYGSTGPAATAGRHPQSRGQPPHASPDGASRRDR